MQCHIQAKTWTTKELELQRDIDLETFLPLLGLESNLRTMALGMYFHNQIDCSTLMYT
jgi:hypothetical protein